MDDIGTYQERDFPAFRNATIDTLEQGRRKHYIPLLLEFDVSEGRQSLARLKELSGQGISFTAWVMKCLAQAVSEHKQVHALRKGRRLVIFDDVDVSVLVERTLSHVDRPGESLPMPYIVRRANAKSVFQIHEEIRAAQDASLVKDEVQIGSRRSAQVTRLFARLPAFLRDLVLWRRLRRNAFLTKKMIGTVVITSLGSTAKGAGGGWAIPLGIHPLIIAVGGMQRKPGVVNEAIEIRDYLSVTVMFDHDVVDGAPAVRFAQRFKELLEHAYGLDEILRGDP